LVEISYASSMETNTLSRRSLLHAIAAAMATAAAPLGWAQVAQAIDQAHAAADMRGARTLSFLTAVEAADVEAVAAQIIPSDDSPGAREAGVIYFIDRALGTSLAQLASDYRADLLAFQSAYRGRLPSAASFASLTSGQQIEFLQTGGDQMPFFNTTRLLTLLGMFTRPSYGGNRNSIGWKLIGFEDNHAFSPPFGYYDRDYPGFSIDPVKAK
jgi:gluconate 2-dehydrogenase gamma chain